MKLTVKKTDLLKELNVVQSVIERRSTLPILSHLLLEAGKEGVAITASDLDVTLRTLCPAQVQAAGAATVPARKLFDIVKLLPDADLALRLGKGEALTVTCGQSTFKLLGPPKDSFPAIPTLPWCASPGATQNGASQKKAPRPILLPGSVLRTLIQRTIFAISQDESRYTLSGALAIFKPNGLTMVSTDGHRLSVVSKAMTLDDLTDEVRVLIPKKALSELVKLTTDDVSVAFGKDENHLFFQVGARLLISRILAGQFPNYELVIPKDNDKVVGFDTALLIDALRRAQVLADERSHAIKLVLDKEQAEVIANSSNTGEAREVVPFSAAGPQADAADARPAVPSEQGAGNGAPVEIGFNAEYLLDFLNATAAPSIVFAFKDPETQVLLKPSDEPDYQTLHIIMPMRT